MCLDKRLPLGKVPAIGYKILIRDTKGNLRFPGTGHVADEHSLMEVKEKDQVNLTFDDQKIGDCGTLQTYKSGFHFCEDKELLAHIMHIKMNGRRLIERMSEISRTEVEGAENDFKIDCFVLYKCSVKEVYEHGKWMVAGEAFVCKKIKLLECIERTTEKMIPWNGSRFQELVYEKN